MPNETGLNLPAFMPLFRRCPHLLPGKQTAGHDGESSRLHSGVWSWAPLTLGSFLSVQCVVLVVGNPNPLGFTVSTVFIKHLLCARHWRHSKCKADSVPAFMGLGVE